MYKVEKKNKALVLSDGTKELASIDYGNWSGEEWIGCCLFLGLFVVSESLKNKTP